MAQRKRLAAERIRTLRQMDHERCDFIPSHTGFTSRYRKAKGGTAEQAQAAEQALERRVATEQGVTDPARVSGDVMARAKDEYLESLETTKGKG